MFEQNKRIIFSPYLPDVFVFISNLIYFLHLQVDDANYDPKTGFSFYVNDLSQQKLYDCSFSRNENESFSLFFNLIIMSNSK